MKKIIRKIFKFLGFSRERHYLKDLINNIEGVYNEQKKITYSIYQIRQKGFVVKVGGLFAFVSFKHMPWQYPNYRYWTLISKSITEKRFYCNIYKVKRKPLLILIDGKIHLFKEIKLEPDREYRAIILNKSKMSFTVDAGYHFEWEYGSFMGLIQPNNLSENTLLLDEGDEMKVRLYRDKQEELYKFVDANIPAEWYNGQIEELIDTRQEAMVILNHANRREYVVQNKYRASTPATRDLYGTEAEEVEKVLKDMDLNQNIPCIVVAVNKEEKKLILKVLYKDFLRRKGNQKTP